MTIIIFYPFASFTFVFAIRKLILKQFVIILLFSLFLIQNFSSYFLIADYYWNKSFISKTLCENKNKPKTHCEGKCYLNKQLSKQSKQDSSPVSADLKTKVEGSAFLVEEIFHSSFTLTVIAVPQFDNYNASYSPGVHRSVFHPPLA